MFRGTCAPWLVRTSLSYFYKARALVAWVHCWDIMHAAYFIGTSAHNSQCFSHFSHSRSAGSTRLRLVLLRTSLLFLKIPACLHNSTMHSARYLFLYLRIELINSVYFHLQGTGQSVSQSRPSSLNWVVKSSRQISET